jgi:hypothetical protein
MLTQLSTVKARLGITEFDVQYDSLLTNAIAAISARFDHETNRTLARTVAGTEEFPIEATEILPACYPIESVTRFEIKATEAEGWVEQTGVNYLIRRKCVISFHSPLSASQSSISYLPAPIARVTYTGGYVLPGTTPGVGQIALPDDLEQAAVEQVASWFENRDKLGLVRQWLHQGTYEQLAQLDLLLPVQSVLQCYKRWGGA